VIPEDVQWIDAGTPDSLVAAALAVQTATREQASDFGYVEIAAYRRGYIDRAAYFNIVEQTPSEAYAQHLRSAAEMITR
jgi:dTDP-glucose pyrophosphorylase